MRQPAYVSRAQCEEVLTVADAIELAERALRWEAAGLTAYARPGTMKLRPAGTAFRFHSKAVALPELNVAGVRVVGYRSEPDGRRPDADETTRIIVLMDLETGFPLAFVDEHYNYSLRTVASVAVGARLLAAAPARIGVVGAGVIARAAVPALLAALPGSSLMLSSRTLSKSEELAELARGLTTEPVTVVDRVDEMLAECDVVVTATTASEPIVRGPLPAGVLVCALGSNELDAAAYLSADRLIVDDWQQTRESGDIAALIAAGHDIEGLPGGRLADLVGGTVAGRRSESETIVLRTEGLASQDILFAHRAWQLSAGGTR
jgi:ornithine cyclodeaminase/alanine dehydrogenase-like protein (mu-crystallin family)